jgi:hypothetical protein
MASNEQPQDTQRFFFTEQEEIRESPPRPNLNNYYIDNLVDPEIGYHSTCFLCSSQSPDFEAIDRFIKTQREKFSLSEVNRKKRKTKKGRVGIWKEFSIKNGSPTWLIIVSK